MTRRTRTVAAIAAACVASWALAAAAAVSGGDAGPRVQAGVRLFRSLLAADMDLERKVDAEGRLLVLVFYAADAEQGDRVARLIAAAPEGSAAATIRDLPVATALASDPAFSAYRQRPPAAIFLAEPPRDETLQRVVRYGIEHGVIVYSPFEGHVEKGVLGGLSVEAKVQPYLNDATLAASRVTLKPFFLKVSKRAR